MLPSFRDLRQEFRPMFRLAVPVVLAEMGWMTMGMVDTLMVGDLGPEAIGAVGVGTSLFMGIVIFGMGLLLGLDTLVSQAYGAGRIDDCHRWLMHGVVLALALTVPTAGALLWMTAALDAWKLNPAVLVLTRPYLEILAWSVLPLLLYSSFRRYLQGMGVVRPVMAALISANIINVICNYLLINGAFGFPRLGVSGSAWATVFSRVVMALTLLATILYRERHVRPSVFANLSLEFSWFRRLIRLGAPAASQVALEVGVFAAATALAGRLAPVALAAHQLALNYAAMTFMVPLGIASSGAVRVGHAVGRGDPPGAARAGWTALLLGVGFMTIAALVFISIPRILLDPFTDDFGVIEVGVTLLFVGAVFQLFDGLQGVATGVLRGLGDTRSPMLWNLAGHWFIGLPLGYWLAFGVGVGVVGLWWGLSIGLMICGVALLIVWARRIHQLEHAAVGTRIADIDVEANQHARRERTAEAARRSAPR